MSDVLQQLLNGLTLGSLYALIAVGYTVVYGIVQLINFAHGEVFMIGAFGALATWSALFQGTLALWVLPIMMLGAIGSPTDRCGTPHGWHRSSPPSASRSSSRRPSGCSTRAPRASCRSRPSRWSRVRRCRSAG